MSRRWDSIDVVFDRLAFQSMGRLARQPVWVFGHGAFGRSAASRGHDSSSRDRTRQSRIYHSI